jgi:hypothetical protein
MGLPYRSGMEGSFGNEGKGALLTAGCASLFTLSLFCGFSDTSSEISLFSLIEGFLPLLTNAILTTYLLFSGVEPPARIILNII